MKKATWGFENIVILQCVNCGRKHYGLNEAQYRHCIEKFTKLDCPNNRCARSDGTLIRLN